MCTEDAGSWIVGQDEFIDSGLSYQFADKIGGNNRIRMYFENGRVSKIITPSTMQKSMIANNERFNGNNKKGEYKAYTEIVMMIGEHGENIPILGRFYTDEEGKQRQTNKSGTVPVIKIDPSKGTRIAFGLSKNKNIEDSFER